VDIPAVFYSLSWFPNPDFSSVFPPQTEILEYLRRVALQHNIPGKIKLQTEFKGARWSEKTSRWYVALRDLESGEDFEHEAKILVSAVGGYTNPRYPTIAGIETFKGPVVHTAKWDRDYILKGCKVIVVGNGCKPMPPFGEAII
jgi:cation diffusion facilitator CzcD-associated flavoprotein CzcO